MVIPYYSQGNQVIAVTSEASEGLLRQILLG
jgi:hypothetical protein